MGMGRFGVGGCCQCAPDTTTSEHAGLCGWCGLYDENVTNLPMPPAPSTFCKDLLTDSFSYSKDYPRVPYWTFQLTYPGTWQESWSLGDYHHLDDGHYVCSSRGRYGTPPNPGPQYSFDLSGKIADLWSCTPYYSGPISVLNLTNNPPFYGSDPLYDYQYPYRYENGLIANSQTDKTDLIPLRETMSLSFSTPKNQWPKYVVSYGAIPRTCIEPPCPVELHVAGAMTSWIKGPCIYTGGQRELLVFGWNTYGQPSQQGGFLGYGLWVTYFEVSSMMRVMAEDNSITELPEPSEQTIQIGYWIGPSSPDGSTPIGSEGDGYVYMTVPYMDSFAMEISVEFQDYPADNRKTMLTVDFKIGGISRLRNQHLIAKPGWRQGSGTSATDEQSYIQSFCPSVVRALNHIVGPYIIYNGSAGYFALWDDTQTPRESFYIDDWQARFERL